MKQKRGIRVIVGTLLGILVLAQGAFLAMPQTVHAISPGCSLCVNGSTYSPATIPSLPSSLGALIANPAQTVQLDPSIYGPLEQYYLANIATPVTNPPFYNGTSSAEESFEKIYNDTYAAVSLTDQNWQNFVNHISADVVGKYGSNGSSSTDVAGYNAAVKSTMQNYGLPVIPPLVETYAGLQILSSLNTTATFNLVSAKYTVLTQQSFTEITHDLDIGVRNNAPTQSGILDLVPLKPLIIALAGGGFLSSPQTKYLIKWNLTTPFQNGSNTSSSNYVYGSTANFYNDFTQVYASMQALYNAPASTSSDIQTGVQSLITMAATVDADGLGVAPGTASSGQCGTPPTAVQIVKAVGQGICALVIQVAGLDAGLVNASGNIVAVMLGLPGGGQSTTGLGNLSSYIPTAIQPAGILDDVNAVPFVAQTIILVNRILGFLIIFCLLVVALANILQIQINTYAIKKAVPALVIGYVLALGAPFATKICIEFSNYLSSAVLSPKLNGNTTVNVSTLDTQMAYVHAADGSANDDPNNLNFADANNDGGVNMAGVFQQGILNIIVLVAAVLMFVLAMLLVARSLIFLVLLPIAPLAFFGITFEPLNGIWKRWWKTTQGWLFMNTVASFWLWLMYKLVTIGSSNGVGATMSGTASATAFLSGIVAYVAGIVCLWLAVTTPFKLAGEAKAIYGKAEKLVNSGKDKALAGSTQYLKDSAAMVVNRNQTFQAVKSKLNDFSDNRKKDIDYAKKGLNYKAIKKDAGKMADIYEKEGELKSIDDGIVKKNEDIDKVKTDLSKATTAQERLDLNKKLSEENTRLATLRTRKADLEDEIKKGERGLSIGSKRNRVAIQRDLFHSKKDELFEEKEDVLKNSSQARVAHKNEHFQELDAEVRDLKSSKEEIGYLGKAELDEKYRKGVDGDNPDELKVKRQRDRVRLQAYKGADEDSAKKDELFSAVDYLYGLKDKDPKIHNITEQEKDAAKRQGKLISSNVDDDVKKDKGYKSGEKVQAKIIANDPANQLTVPEREDALDGVTSLARLYNDATTNVNLENKDKISGALTHLATKLTGTDQSEVSRFAAQIDTASEVNDIKNIVAEFKKHKMGKRLKDIAQNPHEAMLGKKLDDL